MSNELMVSVNCITYNHEKFIADAIESFLMQKTDFKYEILIHDDASTDKTAEIIRGYEERFPDLIKPIYQTENQYSKVKRISKFNIERVKGKYIANCEGDDYWTDPYKLQKQVDYMESNAKCSMCAHGSIHVTEENNRLDTVSRPHHGNKIFTVEEVIEGGGGLFTTNSILYPSRLALNKPDYYFKAPVGDYPLAIHLATQGEVYYIDEFMSAYRVNVRGSFISNLSSSTDKIAKHFTAIAGMLDQVNEETKYRYNEAIVKTKAKNAFNVLLAQERYKELKLPEYKEYYDRLGSALKTKMFIKHYFPGLITAVKKIKG